MNERIKDLVDKAKKQVPAGLAPEQWLAVYHAKFAELIVKECIDTVLDSSVEYATRSQIAGELKEHFGVEE